MSSRSDNIAEQLRKNRNSTTMSSMSTGPRANALQRGRATYQAAAAMQPQDEVVYAREKQRAASNSPSTPWSPGGRKNRNG